MVMLSANSAIVVSGSLGMSTVYVAYRMGARNEPWATAASIGSGDELDGWRAT